MMVIARFASSKYVSFFVGNLRSKAALLSRHSKVTIEVLNSLVDKKMFSDMVFLIPVAQFLLTEQKEYLPKIDYPDTVEAIKEIDDSLVKLDNIERKVFLLS